MLRLLFGLIVTCTLFQHGAKKCAFPDINVRVLPLTAFGITFQLDRIHDYGDIRKPAIANQWCSEYFIDAIWLASDHTLAPGLPSLGMWVGSNE